MASDTGSGFIRRNRPPRVHIAYADPYDSQKMIELPFVMGVMSDLSGNNPGVEKPPVDERKFTDVTKDTLDDYMESLEPGMTFTVDNKLEPDSETKLGVNLQFRSMNDFEPAEVARQIPALKQLLDARIHLANLKKYIAAKPKAAEHVMKLLNDPELMAALAEREGLNKKDDDTTADASADDETETKDT